MSPAEREAKRESFVKALRAAGFTVDGKRVRDDQGNVAVLTGLRLGVLHFVYDTPRAEPLEAVVAEFSAAEKEREVSA